MIRGMGVLGEKRKGGMRVKGGRGNPGKSGTECRTLRIRCVDDFLQVGNQARERILTNIPDNSQVDIDVSVDETVGGYKESGIGRETHKMMLDHYQQTKNLLVSYNPNKLGFF